MKRRNLKNEFSKTSYIYDLGESDSLRSLGLGQRPIYIYIYN